MSEENEHEAQAYLLENLLVIVMFGAAVGLQVLRRKRGLDKKGPLLLRIAEAFSGELV